MDRKLPIGIQSFESMRWDGYVYVDKTAYVYKLVHEGKPYFLSRPRRFGKSLLVSTMRAYLEGRRELFSGLEIERLEEGAAVREGREPWVARPVFHFDLTGQDYRAVALEDVLGEQLARWERTYGASGSVTLGGRFQDLLEAAHAQSGHRAAVLVDEYDKPLLDVMEDEGLLERNRDVLKGFFSVLKKADEHLRFAFITGVTTFSKVSIFSDLNQLRDISFSRDYAGMCGITEVELLAAFEPELDALAAQLGLGHDECLAALRAQYDGYCFHPDGPRASCGEPDGRRVYNPFSLLSALTERNLGFWWFETGTPTFLVRRLRDAELDPKRLTDGTIYATARRLSDYRADDPDPIPLMFQAGYLTIRAYQARTRRYQLAVPNGEVRDGLEESLLPAWAPGYSEARGTDVYSLLDLVEAGDAEGMRDVLAALFASIPYTREDDPFENYFQAVIWLVFALLGRYVRCEVRQARGRADVVVEAREHVYVMELKRDGTAADALAQIEANGYAAPFSADPRQVHLIGCSFDSRTRLLADWEER
ncbi:MAG: ATP-binding protein [Atopobiaceae bacterium]|nr:ATP-binding protein [Atopobiaceae bacterium]